MQLKQLLALALASNALAQDSPPSLEDALASQGSLSYLNILLDAEPAILRGLKDVKNSTILAPSNDAISKFLNNSETTLGIVSNPHMLIAILQYHVLNGTYYGSNFTNSSMFIPTSLNNETYANVTGGQRVEAKLVGGNVTFFSALKENSTVTTANVNFTGGTIHIVDSVLQIPLNDNATLIGSNLTAAAGAIQQAGAADNLTSLRDVTIFAPSNAAFNSIGSLAANLSSEQLASILQYHVIPKKVAYSDTIQNSTVMTAGGQNVTLTVENGTIYVNSAKVIEADLLVSNGVIHVIDNVLNPMNATASPNPSASGNAGPAFSGASSVSGGGIPFTSGVATPTSTAPAATGASTSSSGLGVPMKTAAVGAAALFGGAAMLANF